MRLRAMVSHLRSHYALRRMAAQHKSQYLRVLSQRALARFDLAYARFFGESKTGFNPDQPRVPTGNPDGGQWTGVGGQGARQVRLAGERPGSEEHRDPLLNRHIIDQHVGKTDEELKARIRREQFRGLFLTAGRDRNGSFDSIESARDFIERTIENHPESVASVASGRSKQEFLTWRFGYVTGREAYLDPRTSDVRIRNTYNVGVAIAHDPSAESGYRVVSAYPRNYNPRIGR
jgi:CDI toxin RNase A-like protein